MMQLFAVLILYALCAGAHARQLYKCSTGGKVSYASAPCDGAAVTQITVPAAPASDPAAGAELKRQKALLAGFEKARQAREARDERAAQVTARAAALRRQRCARLALKQRWADDVADRAAGFGKEALQEKARRMGEIMAIECPH